MRKNCFVHIVVLFMICSTLQAENKIGNFLLNESDVIIPDFQVNENVGRCDKHSPKIALSSNTNFVVTWYDYRNGNWDIYCQRYKSNGTKIGDNLLVNDDAGSNIQNNPSVAIDDNGNFVVVWEDYRSGNGITYCQLYNNNGEKVGNNFIVNNKMIHSLESNPAVAMDTYGNFVITWQDFSEENWWDIYIQRYTRGGIRIGNSILVNDNSSNSIQCTPDIAIESNGNFAITWQDYRNGNEDIYCQRYLNDGTKVGNNFLVNDDLGGSLQYDPNLAVDGNGNIIITWVDVRSTSKKSEIYSQRYSSNGIKKGTNFLVNDDLQRGDISNPDVSIDQNGNFTYVWSEKRSGYLDIYCQCYNNNGTKMGTAFIVNDIIENRNTSAPAIAMDDKGNFVVAWEDFRISRNMDIYCQCYSSNGIRNSTNYQVNDDVGSGSQYYSNVDVNENGKFVIVWQDGNTLSKNIFCQSYDSIGIKINTNFQVNGFRGINNCNTPVTAIDSNGNYIVVWMEFYGGNNNHIVCQLYKINGTKIGENIIVNDGLGYSYNPAIAMDSNGNFIVVWNDNRSGTHDVYCQRFTSGGVKVGVNFIVNEDTRSDQLRSAITMNDNGNFAVTWLDFRNKMEIYCQLYTNSGVKIGTNSKVNDDIGSFEGGCPVIAMDDIGNFMVAWQFGLYINSSYDICYQLYTNNGIKSGKNILVNDDGINAKQSMPVISINKNGNIIIAWMDNRNGNWDIYGQKYRNDSIAFSSNFKISNDKGNNDQINPSIALKENTLIATWEDDRIPGQGWDIYANMINLAWNNTPDVITYSPIYITTTSALLNGSVNAQGTNTTVKFQYGTTTNYGTEVSASQSPVRGSHAVSVSAAITGLTSGTIYHYRVVATNSAGTSNGSDQTFTTLTNAPTTTTNSASNPTTTSAVLNGSVNPQGTITTVKFQYGTTTNYGTELTASQSPVNGSSAVSVSAAITGLTPGTIYHYRVVATNSAGTSNGSDQTFTTLANLPTATTNSASNPTTASATLNGLVNPQGTSTTIKFQYGTTTNYGTEVTASQSPVNGSSAVSVSAVISNLTPGTTYHYQVVATNAGGTTLGGDQTFTTLSLDNQAPSIVHSATSTAVGGQAITLNATITDNKKVNSAALYYRQGGQSSFASVAMSKTSGNTYKATIPAGSVTERGVEYYISAVDSSGNTSTNPSGGAGQPYSIRVSYSSLACPNSTLANDYRMVSVPGELQNKGTSSVLSALGAHDRTKWRLLQVKGDRYLEYGVDTDVSGFDPGKAFWLITKDALNWSCGSGQSVSTSEGFALDLVPGWNHIANPFAFDVSWGATDLGGKNIGTPVGYDQIGQEPLQYQYNQTSLKPWKGYLVRNREGANARIYLKSISTGMAKTGIADELIDGVGEWVIQIKVTCGRYGDWGNWLGCVQGAERTWDKHDISEAPPMGDYASAVFKHRDWTEYQDDYTGDFRPVSADGEVWEIEVKSNIKQSQIRMNYEFLKPLPDGWGIAVTDLQYGLSKSLTDGYEQTFTTGHDETVRHFRVIAGKPEYIEGFQTKNPVIPQAYELFQNYPNPFNSSTIIGFTLPERTAVTIRVHTVRGEVVKVLESGVIMDAGYHDAVWDGKDASGGNVPSGVYLVSLQAGNRRFVSKILLSK